jgi:hypothetical protein
MKELKEFDKKISDIDKRQHEFLSNINKEKRELEEKYRDVFLKKVTEILDTFKSNGITQPITYLSKVENYIKSGIKHEDAMDSINQIHDVIHLDLSHLTAVGDSYRLQEIVNGEVYAKDYEIGQRLEIGLDELDVRAFYDILITFITNPLVSGMINADSYVSLNERIKDFKSFTSK